MNLITELLNTLGQTDKIKLQSKAEKIKSWSLSQDVLEEERVPARIACTPATLSTELD